MSYLKGLSSNYDKYPTTAVKGYDQEAWTGYPAILNELTTKLTGDKQILVIDCTVGVDNEELKQAFAGWYDSFFDSLAIFYDSEKMNEMLSHYVTDDRVFGVAYHGQWRDFVDLDKLATLKQEVEAVRGKILIAGVGASLITDGDLLVFADMTIWELQRRYRTGLDNFNAKNYTDETTKKFKRGYFVDWRLSNFHKDELFKKMAYYLDTVVPQQPKMLTTAAFEAGLVQMLNQPFRLIPFFDEGLWGGQWMKEVLDVPDKKRINYAWSYNLLFPENSVGLVYGDIQVEVAGYTVCRAYPKQLIGEKGYSRFGCEYPIRYDFLDTMQGGNLSLQVHPTTQYFQEHFGLSFTQDESYYFLDCADQDTYMYLGLTDQATRQEMERDLWRAQAGEIVFPAEKYANKIPVKKHQHYQIPAGTVHCSGADTLVLEISSAPCIFTFKLWDWGRVDWDGRPRPINITRGMEVIDWDKSESWIRETCAFPPLPIAQGEGWRQEKTGLHQAEFIEIMRYWQRVKVSHQTQGETQALNLIAGREALIESPGGQFEPFVMHFAESVVIPALIPEYTISPYGESARQEIGVLVGYVRY